nr:LOW QUALITY PROTEIN: uncharacterized protein LOC128701328 [Cherax quadricarinatus]
MFVNKAKMEATSNWTVENDLKLHQVIQETSSFPTGDLVDLLDEDKCFSLSRPATEQVDCCIRLVTKHEATSARRMQQGLKSKTKKLLLGITMLSEARVIEVYTGSHDEYCMTVQGKVMRDFEDSKIYKCEVRFDKLQEAVLLKLKGIFDVNSLWVYGFHVTIGVEAARQPGSRFGSDHLSSVLKEKDVQMSKQAMMFCQMLENYNSVNDSSKPFLGNNPMALMSMMLGPMMSESRSVMSGMETTGKHEVINKTLMNSCSDMGHTVQTQDMPKGDSVRGCELKTSLDLFANRPCLATNIQDETQFNLQNGIKNLVLDCEDGKFQENKVMFDQSSTENGEKSKDSPSYSDNFVEKLHALINDGNNTVDQQKLCPLLDIAFKAGTTSNLMESAKDYFSKSSGVPDQARSNPLLGSQSKVPILSNNQHVVKLSPNGYSGSFGATKTTEEEGSMDLPTTGHQGVPEIRYCTGSNKVLLNCIEILIDKKLAVFEKRIMQKIEQKLLEKDKKDTIKLEKIEGLLSKLCDKL